VQSIHKFQSEVGGALRGGEGGVRMFEPREPSKLELYPAAPDPGVEAPREPDEVTVVPVHAVFGSEELSVRAPAIAQLAPRAAIALAPETAERLGLADGDEVELAMRGASVTLPVRKASGMAPGVAGFPAGFPGVPTVELPCAGRVRKVSA
jgi:NADH-quinone oxidoreductase subunit G